MNRDLVAAVAESLRRVSALLSNVGPLSGELDDLAFLCGAKLSHLQALHRTGALSRADGVWRVCR